VTGPATPIGQVIPSAAAEEAAQGLSGLLKSRVPDEPAGDYYAQDFSQLWQDLADGGWTCVADGAVPGTSDELTLLDLASLAEVWGGWLIPLPLVPTLGVRRWLRDRPEQGIRLTYAISRGGMSLIPFGSCSDLVCCSASDPAETRQAQSFVPGELDTFSPSLPISIAEGVHGELPADMIADIAILTAAEAVGAAAAVLRRAVAYAKVREQFGKPIGSFQAVKHRLANMHCDVELARSAIAWCCADRASLAEATTSVTELTLKVAEDAIQVHGGIGCTWEAGVHWYLRHVMCLQRVLACADSSR
jgi:hypothetical protein